MSRARFVRALRPVTSSLLVEPLIPPPGCTRLRDPVETKGSFVGRQPRRLRLELLLGDTAVPSAMLDHLLHRSGVMSHNGGTYRLRANSCPAITHSDAPSPAGANH